MRGFLPDVPLALDDDEEREEEEEEVFRPPVAFPWVPAAAATSSAMVIRTEIDEGEKKKRGAESHATHFVPKRSTSTKRARPVNLREGLSLNDPACRANVASCGIYDRDEELRAFAAAGRREGRLRLPRPRPVAGLERVPAAALAELAEQQREEIRAIRDAESLERALARYRAEEDNLAYQVAMIQHAHLLEGSERQRARLFGELYRSPAERDEPAPLSLPERYEGKGPATMKAVQAIAAALRERGTDQDYGEGLADAEAAILRTLEAGGPGGDSMLALFDYANTLFAQFRDTVARPWDVGRSGQSNDSAVERLSAVVAAQRGLEGRALPASPGNTCFRWVDGIEDHRPGDLISPLSLLSASAGERASEAFAKPDQPRTLLIIDGESGGRLIQLLAGTKNWYQREVLFPCYAQFVVRSRRDRGPNEVWYVLDQLPGPLGQLDDEAVAGIGLGGDETGYAVSPELADQTLVDRRHRELFAGGARPSRAALEEAGVELPEGADASAIDAGNVYGAETHRRWGAALRHRGSRRGLLTQRQLEQYHQHLSGAPAAYRTDEVGWGEATDVFSLAPHECDALTGHGLLHYPTVSVDRLAAFARWVRDFSFRGKIDTPSGKVSKSEYLATIEKALEAGHPLPVLEPVMTSFLASSGGGYDIRAQRFTVSHGVPEEGQLAEELRGVLARTSSALEQLLALLVHRVIDLPTYLDGMRRHATALQQDIVSLHPFEDGNGRLSRMMMYKVLQAYSPSRMDPAAAFPAIDDPGLDLRSTKDEWFTRLFPPRD